MLRKAQRIALKLTATTGLTALALCATTLVPTTAMADSGDGNLACSVGEICFKKNVDGNYLDYIKHFWYGADHGGYIWGGQGDRNGGNVQFNASMHWNRDTKCDVWMSDQYGSTYKLPRQNDGYKSFSSIWNDANFAHARCRPDAPGGE